MTRRGNPAGALPQPLDVPDLAPSGGSWAQVVTYGELVVVSGQCAVDAAGSVLADASALEQAKQVFRNVDLALQAAGSSHRGILKLSTYVVSLEDLPAVRAARDEWLGNCRPASTLVQVAGLVDSALLVEVDVLAVRTRA